MLHDILVEFPLFGVLLISFFGVDRTTDDEVPERSVYPAATTPRKFENFRLSDQGLASQDWPFTNYWHDPVGQVCYSGCSTRCPEADSGSGSIQLK